MVKSYVPKRGDIVWLHFDPQAGHEQGGHRPALVLSSQIYNQRVGLALFCPITSKVKNYPFEVTLPSNGDIQGVILADQVKSFDWKARQAKYITTILGDKTMDEVLAKLKTLLA